MMGKSIAAKQRENAQTKASKKLSGQYRHAAAVTAEAESKSRAHEQRSQQAPEIKTLTSGIVEAGVVPDGSDPLHAATTVSDDDEKATAATRADGPPRLEEETE